MKKKSFKIFVNLCFLAEVHIRNEHVWIDYKQVKYF